MKEKADSAYASVRITSKQYEKLKELCAKVPGFSVNGLVQDAVETMLECEAPIWLATAQRVQQSRAGRKPAA